MNPLPLRERVVSSASEGFAFDEASSVCFVQEQPFAEANGKSAKGPEAEISRAATVTKAIWFSATDFPLMFAYAKLSRVFMLKVLVLKDEETPMEFFVSVLQEIFGYSEDEASRIALHAHLNGEATCCICPSPVDAEAWINKATALSELCGYPLEFSVVSIPFTERAGAWVFNAVMKVAPN